MNIAKTSYHTQHLILCWFIVS